MDLPDRMKMYEDAYRFYLPKRFPVIIRLDGKAFHSLTKKLKLEKPHDAWFTGLMIGTAQELLEGIQGTKMAYTQSDEISLLVTNNDTFTTEAWFDNNIQKMVSISAATASVYMTSHLIMEGFTELALFDSRVFILPQEDANNYFVWRQRDCMRNSILGYAQEMFGHAAVQGKNISELQDMMFLKEQFNWGRDVDDHFKNGVCLSKEVIYDPIPQFSKEPKFIEQFLQREGGEDA